MLQLKGLKRVGVAGFQVRSAWRSSRPAHRLQSKAIRPPFAVSPGRRVVRVEDSEMWGRYVEKREAIHLRRSEELPLQPLEPPAVSDEAVDMYSASLWGIGPYMRHGLHGHPRAPHGYTGTGTLNRAHGHTGNRTACKTQTTPNKESYILNQTNPLTRMQYTKECQRLLSCQRLA